jgi:chemotaxis protein MotB
MGRHKKKGHGGEAHGNSERWLLTYADMITLLMAFFIMMYSMSILNLEKFKSVAISIRSGFGGKMDGGAHLLTHPEGQRSVQQAPVLEENKSMQETAQELEEYIDTHNLGGSVQVRVEERGLVISILTDNMLFPIGSSEPQPITKPILDRVAKIIKNSTNKIQIEGHTCNLPIHTNLFPSNWELSSARASRVVRCLIEQHHIPPYRLSAAGYADTRPIVPNDTEKHRRLNRRVDIVLLASTIESPSDTNGLRKRTAQP